VALPIIALSAKPAREFIDNALGNLAFLAPRNLLRAFDFAHSLKLKASQDRAIKDLIRRYVYAREDNFGKWERAALQDRASLQALYVRGFVKPQRAVFGEILFERKYPAGSVFEVLRQLKDRAPLEIANEIVSRKIPFIVALGALGEKRKNPDVLMALIERMSPTELVTNMKSLEKLGVRQVPALRAALESALKKAAKSGANMLKTTAAAEAVEDEVVAGKLQELQEKQIDRSGSVEGDWLVLADRSPSMDQAIDVAKHVSSTLARVAKGRVHLIFFDGTISRVIDATGRTLAAIQEETAHVKAGGRGTSIGCGVLWAIDNKKEYGGIAIVSDAQENSAPGFANEYRRYCEIIGKQIPVYLYRCTGSQAAGMDVDLARSMARAGFDLQEFDLRGTAIDYYALPNLIQTMRTNRYGLIEEIMDVPLVKLDAVLPRKEDLVSC
jgi:hypothetical protein